MGWRSTPLHVSDAKARVSTTPSAEAGPGRKGQHCKGNSKSREGATAAQRNTNNAGGIHMHFGYCGYCGKLGHATSSCWHDPKNKASGKPSTTTGATNVTWRKIKAARTR